MREADKQVFIDHTEREAHDVDGRPGVSNWWHQTDEYTYGIHPLNIFYLVFRVF